MKTRMDIDPEYRDALRAAGLAGYDAMMRVAGGAALGWHRNRETVPLKINVNGGPKDFFVKRVFKVPPRHSFWPLLRLRRGHAQPVLEWRILGELDAAGIPAMRRVAFGERRRWGMPVSGFLLVEAVPMQHTLENWLVPGFAKPAALSKQQRDRLIEGLGGLIGRLQSEGFLWPDMVAKHIFAAPDRDAGWMFSLIDVERMTRALSSGRASRRPGDVALRQIRALRRSLLPMPLDRHDAERFAAGCAAEKRGSHGRDHLAEWVDASCRPRLPSDYEHPRCVSLVHSRGMVCDARVMPLLAASGITGLKDVLAFEAGASLRKPGLERYRDRIRLSLDGGKRGGEVFYLKRYHRPPFGQQLRRMLGGMMTRGSAYREVRFVKRLSQLGIPTMQTVAYGQKMRGVWEVASFAVTRALAGVSLERAAEQALHDPAAAPAWQDRKEILRQLALIVRLLHQNRLYHRDLYLCHVFLTRNEDGAIVLRLIDLARMLEKPRLEARWRIKDLAALDHSAPAGMVTKADRLRFLYDYLEESDTDRPRMCRLLGSVRARVARMVRHDANRKRRFEREARE